MVGAMLSKAARFQRDFRTLFHGRAAALYTVAANWDDRQEMGVYGNVRLGTSVIWVSLLEWPADSEVWTLNTHLFWTRSSADRDDSDARSSP